jgi:hypothetical protein
VSAAAEFAAADNPGVVEPAWRRDADRDYRRAPSDIVVDLRGRLVVALTLTFGEDRISRYTVVVASARSCWVARRAAAASSKLR